MTALFTAIVIVSIVIIVLPFYKNTHKEFLHEEAIDPIAALMQKKENLLQSMRELDFDFETGKISAQDYKELRATTQAQTVQVLKDIEQAQMRWQEMEKQC
ncbi:MAG: hypothetical protein KDK51_01500 [Deltaproteobacteria bacterium]|nr:hypothetical protein [Deltaproteobacteria bacterium]